VATFGIPTVSGELRGFRSLNITVMFDPFNLPALTHRMRDHLARYDNSSLRVDVALAPPAQTNPSVVAHS